MEEDIKVLEEILKVRKEQKEIIESVGGYCGNCNPDIKALTNAIQAIKENIIIKTAKEEVEELLENSIPISKIQEKIEDLKRYIYTGENAPQDFLQYRVKAKIQILEELLEE